LFSNRHNFKPNYFLMKKLVLFSFLTLAIIACKDEEPDQDLDMTTNMPGPTWNLISVRYFAIVPNPDNPAQLLPINGAGEQVAGGFTFQGTPNNSVTYDIRFSGVIPLPQGAPMVIPVSRQGTGVWEVGADNKSVSFFEANDTLRFTVAKNTASEQVWTTMIPYFIPDVGDTVDIEVETTMRR
jgi:hypothetical protein